MNEEILKLLKELEMLFYPSIYIQQYSNGNGIVIQINGKIIFAYTSESDLKEKLIKEIEKYK